MCVSTPEADSIRGVVCPPIVTASHCKTDPHLLRDPHWTTLPHQKRKRMTLKRVSMRQEEEGKVDGEALSTLWCILYCRCVTLVDNSSKYRLFCSNTVLPSNRELPCEAVISLEDTSIGLCEEVMCGRTNVDSPL